MQNKLIAAMSSVVTKGIKQEIGHSCYTIEVDAPRAQLVRKYFLNYLFFSKHSLKVAKRLLVLLSTDSGDGKSISDVIWRKLLKQDRFFQRHLVKSMMAHL